MVMNIDQVVDVEDCFDGSFIKEVLFDDLITERFIRYLGETGELQYYRSFARPYFRVESPRKFILMGVEGNRSLRIVLYRGGIQESLEWFRNYVSGFGTREAAT